MKKILQNERNQSLHLAPTKKTKKFQKAEGVTAI